MAKYLFLYRSEPTDQQPSPEEMQQIMKLWTDWINEGFAQGWMLDPGDGLQPAGKVVDADLVVTDGPFAESKEVIGGYSIIQADSLDKAAEIAKSNPMIKYGGKVEVRELAGLQAESE